MSSHELSSSSILCENAARSVFLVDIPLSIALAQYPNHFHAESSFRVERVPYSVPPPESPYPSTEPKRASSQAFQNEIETSFPVDLLKNALAEIDDEFRKKPWCIQRQWQGLDKQAPKALKSEQPFTSPATEYTWNDTEPLELSTPGAFEFSRARIINRLVCNNSSQTTKLDISSAAAKYYLPPLSSFLLSTIDSATVMSFCMSALHHHPAPSPGTSAGPGEFDIIVMDPPWPNRSARRSRQYQMTNLDEGPIDALRTTLSNHIAPSGIVACWITNKRAVRKTALDLFAAWGLTLAEEWAWLKVTRDGRPVCSLDGVWKKPFEVLLVGRKDTAMQKLCARRDAATSGIRRRVLAAVPDLHSRKPNLKELIEQLLINKTMPYRALEIFARSLTSGWWAWGDEVLKYNNIQAWAQPGTQ